MKHSQWIVFGVGSVIAGVTVWYAMYGVMPDDLGTVITGTLLSIGFIVMAFVGLEEKTGKKEGK